MIQSIFYFIVKIIVWWTLAYKPADVKGPT